MPRPSTRPNIEQVVTEAKRFTCAILCNQRLTTAEFKTLHDAREAAPIMERLANNHRKAMIYAIDQFGQSHFVPNDVLPDSGF